MVGWKSTSYIGVFLVLTLFIIMIPNVFAGVCFSQGYALCSESNAINCVEPNIYVDENAQVACQEGCLCVSNQGTILNTLITYQGHYTHLQTQNPQLTYNFNEEITNGQTCQQYCEVAVEETCTENCESNICLQGQVTQECLCGNEIINDGYCCFANPSETECVTSCPIGIKLSSACDCAGETANINQYCCGQSISNSACGFGMCPQNTNLAEFNYCMCEDVLYEDIGQTAYCCNGNLQQTPCTVAQTCQIDGTLQSTEQCDPQLGFTPSVSSCNAGAIGCSDICECVYEVGCNAPNPQCQTSAECSEQQECAENICMCIPINGCLDASCNPSPCSLSNPPQTSPILQVKQNFLSPNLEVLWTYNDLCPTNPVESYDVYVNGNFFIQTEQRQFLYDIFPQEDDVNVCFKISAKHADGVQSAFSQEICVNQGDIICFNEEEKSEFCKAPSGGTTRNIRIACSNEEGSINQAEESSCPSGYLCMPFGNKAVCTMQSDCQRCNGVYDIFATYGETEYNGNDQSCFEEYIACYLDTVDAADHVVSATPKFLECSHVTSCYDYKSEQACSGINADHCQIGGCSWQIINEESGFGICKSDQEPKCNFCNDINSPYFSCDQTTCPLFGNCYFNNNNQCISVEEIICEDYRNEQDCSGEFDAEVTYASEDIDKRVGGTHSIIQNSNDKFNLGKCKWEENRCFRDADNNYRQGQYPAAMDIEAFNPKEDERFQDFENPITTHAAPQVSGTYVKFPIGAYDEKTSVDKTYLCLSSNGQSCYPTDSDYISGGYFENEFEEANMYTIYFYSEDEASNIEQVKQAQFTVTNASPYIKITPTYTTQNFGENYILSDVNIKVEIFSNEELTQPMFATCSGGFIGDNSPAGGPDIDDAYGQIFTQKYYYVADGYYNYKITCVNEYGNEKIEERIINIDGDQSITNILPAPTTYKNTSDLTITFQTGQTANCKYDSNEKLYAQMQNSASTIDGRSHSFIVEDLDSGIYHYYIACDAQGQIFEAIPGDYALFAVDKIPPITYILDHQGNLFDFAQHTNENFELKFFCNDNNPLLYQNNVNWNAGCDETWFKTRGKPYVKYTNQPLSKTVQDSPLQLFSQDTLQNIEKLRTIELIVRDVEPAQITLFEYYNNE